MKVNVKDNKYEHIEKNVNGFKKTEENKIVKLNTETHKIIFDETPLINELIVIIVEYIFGGEYIEGNLYKIIGKGEPLEFAFPIGMATDGTYIYVCDSENHQIKILYQNGDLYRSFEDREIQYPCYIAIHHSKIYVTNKHNKIQVLNISDGRLIREISCDSGCDDIVIYENDIYVLHYKYIDVSINVFGHAKITQAYISVYTLDGTLIRTIDLNSIIKIANHYPTGISITNNEIYLAYCWAGVVVCLSIDGKYKFELKGCDNGKELKMPYHVLATKESIYVGDKNKIYHYTKEGKFIKKIEVNNDAALSSMTFLKSKLYVVCWSGMCIYIFE